jgi:hypothetical protein
MSSGDNLNIPEEETEIEPQSQLDNLQDSPNIEDEKLIDKKKLIEIIASTLILVAAALQGLGDAMHAYVDNGIMTEDEAKEKLMNEINDRTSNITKYIQSGGVGENINAIQKYSVNSQNQLLNQPVTNVPGAAETVDAIFKIGSLTKDVLGATIGKVASGSYNLAKDLVGVGLIKLEESILGQQLANLPEGTTAEKLNYLSQLINEIAEDPEARQAITNLSKSIANLGIQTLEATQPELDELTDKFWTVVNGIASKSAVSAVTTAVSTIMAVIADIPVIGGIIVDMFFAAKVFNNLSETAGYSIEKSTEVFKKGVQTLGTAAGVVADNATPVVESVQEAQQAISNALDKANTISQNVTNINPLNKLDTLSQEVQNPLSQLQQSGGAEGLKKNKEKVKNIKKRIHKTIKKFKGEKELEVKQNKRKSRKHK